MIDLGRKVRVVEARQKTSADAALWAEPERDVVALAPMIDTPEQVRARFFKECLLPINGQRIGAAQLYVAYVVWYV